MTVHEFLGLPEVPIWALDVAQRRIQEAAWLDVNLPGFSVIHRQWRATAEGGVDVLKVEGEGRPPFEVTFRVTSAEPETTLPGLSSLFPVKVGSVADEYAWVVHVFGQVPDSQRLLRTADGPRDVLTLQLPEGPTDLWFDISPFFS